MLKKFLSVLLCAILLTSLAACAPGEGTNTDGQNTSTGSTEGEKQTVQGYDEDLDHIFFATDIKDKSIVIFDLSLANGYFPNLAKGDQCVIWEWDADEDRSCKVKPGALDSAKLRYSPYYQKDVVIATASSGWAGIIDYENRTVLWEVSGIHNAHSIEMLPNGDVVVAASGTWTEGSDSYADGGLHYFPAGKTKRSSFVSLPFAHAILWDPDAELLWSVGFEGVVAIHVDNMGSDQARMSKIAGMGVKRVNFTGHDMVPAVGMDGMYWVSDNEKLWLFDSKELTLTSAPSRYNSKSIKGIAYFSDQTMIQTIAGSGDATTDWTCGEIRIVTMEMSTGKVQKLVSREYDIAFTDREFYKVTRVTKDYK